MIPLSFCEIKILPLQLYDFEREKEIHLLNRTVRQKQTNRQTLQHRGQEQDGHDQYNSQTVKLNIYLRAM